MITFYSFASLKKYPHLLHAVTQKSLLYPCSLSLALHTGEKKEEILENREQVAVHFGTDEVFHFVVANQTHSEHIKVIDKAETKGWESEESAIEDCDALITREKKVILTILTADCVPILLYDPKQEVVAAVHAGWKGTQARIVAKTVLKMADLFNSKPEDVLAAVAPSIGKCCYEVGEDVARYFLDTPNAFSEKGDKFMLDLPYINKYQLRNAGLKESHIEMSGVCTACDVTHYFSYRREQGCSGRFMSMIGLV